MPLINAESAQKLEKLVAFLRPRRNLLIVLQDHPDPDAIAGAAALRAIAHVHPELTCSVAAGGAVGRAENRALVAYLGLNIRPTEELNFASYDALALLDTQPGTGNNSLTPGVRPDIVIDHHPVRNASRGLPFTDIRSGYGATSTILTEYLVAAHIEPDPPLATALLYGIRSDTQDLGREAKKADIGADLYLAPLANLRMLAQIRQASLPPRYFELLRRALSAARVYGRGIIADLGEVDNPDMMGEVADLLLRRESTEWSVCMGALPQAVILSVRTRDPESDAGQVMRRIVRNLGSGGGHNRFAGGQVPRRTGSQAELARIVRTLHKRILRAFGHKSDGGEPLVA